MSMGCLTIYLEITIKGIFQKTGSWVCTEEMEEKDVLDSSKKLNEICYSETIWDSGN